MGSIVNAVTAWDASVITAISENVHSTFLNYFFRFVTLLGEGGIFWIAVAVILLFFKKTRRTGICIGASLLIGVIIGNGVIKNVVARPRPYDTIPGIEPLIAHLSDFSFPSGHTLCCFEAATALMMNRSRWAIPAFFAAVLVGISRLFLFVHYPTDVICGALLGILFGVLGSVVAGAIYDRVSRNIAANKDISA